MTSEKVTLGKTEYLVKAEDAFVSVCSRHEGIAVASNVTVKFFPSKIEVIEDRTNAPEPWVTTVVPLRSGGYQVESRGRIVAMHGHDEIISMGSNNEYRGIEDFKQQEPRVFSAIHNALKATLDIEDKNLFGKAHVSMLQTHAKNFAPQELQVG